MSETDLVTGGNEGAEVEAELEMTDVALRWVTEHEAAFVNHDARRAEALYGDRCVYVWHPFRVPHRGIAAVSEHIARTFEAQRDMSAKFAIPLVAGSTITVQYWMTFTYVDQSRPFTICGAQIVSFGADGLAAQIHDYWHLSKGAEPAPAWFDSARV